LNPVTDELARRIARSGPIPFDEYMDAVLYGPAGFYRLGGGAGRSERDFVTSPHTGSLFGALVARMLDEEWAARLHPDPFVVIECGAGDGRLAADVLRAAPACATALRYVLVEISPALRARQCERLAIADPAMALGGFAIDPAEPDGRPEPLAGIGPILTQLEALPAGRGDAMIIANELLDNLPIAIAQRLDPGWGEVRVTCDGTRFGEIVIPQPELDLGEAPVGTRLPRPVGLAAWLLDAARVATRIVCIDYVVPRAEVVRRSPDWLRTYSAHRRGNDPYADPGRCDITADVMAEDLVDAARRARLRIVGDDDQAQWCADLGIAELVAEAEQVWRDRAHLGDLTALAARSRALEAGALTDPAGLGSFRVVTLAR
jgi:NADH dehydrogenase [ubiquinone] 1 alpha subcomplex assembly factor 7